LQQIHFKSIVILAIIDHLRWLRYGSGFKTVKELDIGVGGNSGKLRGKYKKVGTSERAASLKVSLFWGG
jgi:hypothetical protein